MIQFFSLPLSYLYQSIYNPNSNKASLYKNAKFDNYMYIYQFWNKFRPCLRYLEAVLQPYINIQELLYYSLFKCAASVLRLNTNKTVQHSVLFHTQPLFKYQFSKKNPAIQFKMESHNVVRYHLCKTI